MIFEPTPLAGAFVIRLQELADVRGFFARSFCEKELAGQGVAFEVTQCNVSFNKRAGTVRGMHYQVEPHPELKIVRVTAGAIHDVIIDLRPESKTYLKSFGIELTAKNRLSLLIPTGMAHGFQTLADETEVFYLMSGAFHAASARGVRHDDPVLKVNWPLPVSVISDKDRSYGDFKV
jgi:dTDP-4-dehydrorhamnose 3,5-epimerase